MAVIQTGADGVRAPHLLAIDQLIQGQVLALCEGEGFGKLRGYIECQYNRFIGVPDQLFNTQWKQLLVQIALHFCCHMHLK